jgi:excinuclease ABC subunit C
MLVSFMRQFYETAPIIPSEILLDRTLPDGPLLQDWLTGLKGRNVKILTPQRGPKRRLLKMAQRNASQALEAYLAASRARMEVLALLQRRLKLQRMPMRIECFDNSSLAGTEPVASQVVFQGGRRQKDQYRRYRIRSVAQQDDYAYLAEVLRRRYAKEEASQPYPDLLMVDGGKGQLNMALAVMDDLGLGDAFDVIGIAKPDPVRGEHQDKIYKPGQANPVLWGRDQKGLLLLQRIRDEAHRCAVTFQRQRRHKRSLRSALDAIPGIGPKRKAALMKHFKSFHALQAASLADLCRVNGINHQVAETLIAHFQQKGRHE